MTESILSLIPKGRLSVLAAICARVAILSAIQFLASPNQACGATAEAIDEATKKGVAFLLSEQDPRGAIREHGSYDTAMTALSCLAMAAVGHLPSDRTPQGVGVRKGIDFLLMPDRQDNEGYFGSKDNSRMYGHGITTLFLSEMLGMGADAKQDAALRAACMRAISLILRSQAVAKSEGHKGGWRYTPLATDSDLSVSIWQLIALRSAKNAGLDIPKDGIDDAVAYIRRCFKGSTKAGAAVGFGYTYTTAPVWSTATEGLLAMQVCGHYEAPEVIATADWLLKNPPKVKGNSWFYYGTYYYAQGMYQRGDAYAAEASERVAEVLLPMQDADGSWKPSAGSETNRIYRTAMALLSLSVKYHYLPIYQR
jgi:hypothetical protein